MRRVVAQRLANLADGRVDAVVGVEEDALTPNLFDNLIAGHKFAALLNKQAQQVGWNAFQPEGLPGLFQLKGSEVKFEVAAKSDRS
ncbi:MAG TPA: hypothetical protein VLL05_07350 [Terriglobales bacterium]|nr:hypothetical protein [Terriglobales bacterium]